MNVRVLSRRFLLLTVGTHRSERDNGNLPSIFVS
jgi:hypothetical protein